MLFTTTSHLEGWIIEEYLGTVSTHAVLGSGVLTEFLSGFSDFFGVQSGAYREKLDELEGFVSEQLIEKATFRRATAVIGLRVDYDSVSVGNKSLLMVTARGTAVRARATSGERTNIAADRAEMSDTTLALWSRRLEMRSAAQSKTLPLDDDETWKFLTQQRAAEFAQYVLTNFSEGTSAAEERLDRYFATLSAADRQKALYAALSMGPLDPACVAALGVLIRGRHLSPNATLELLASPEQHHRWAAVQTLRARQTYYRLSDALLYDQLAEALRTTVFMSAPTRAKNRKLLAAKEVWTCNRCGNGEAEGERCGCTADRQGFRSTSDMTPLQARAVAAGRANLIRVALSGDPSSATGTIS